MSQYPDEIDQEVTDAAFRQARERRASLAAAPCSGFRSTVEKVRMLAAQASRAEGREVPVAEILERIRLEAESFADSMSQNVQSEGANQ